MKLSADASIYRMMNLAPGGSSFQVQQISAAAGGWLSHGQCGKVLAAVSHATYLLTEKQNLVWLATADSPMHRRCLRVPFPLPRMAAETAFTASDHSLRFESGAHLDFHASQIYDIPVLPAGNLIPIERLPKKLSIIYDTILARKTPVGFGRMIQPILSIANEKYSIPLFQPEDTLVKSAWLVMERIARACLCHDFIGVLRQAGTLIGLGEGLTPSGDDFLGGLFFARHLLSCSYPQLDYLEFYNLPDWIDAHRSRTNLISFTLLKDNALGHASDPLSRFGIALLTNQSIGCELSAASELTTMGHSTGWDMLAGFLTGMLLACTD